MNSDRKHIGIERRMGTQRLPNITSMSIRRPPAHEKAARATVFSLRCWRPRATFFPTVKIDFHENTMFWADLATGFGYVLDPFWGAVLGTVCRLWVWMCVCVCVWLSDTIG